MRSIALACALAACGGSPAPEPEKQEPPKAVAEPKEPGFDLSRREIKQRILDVNAHVIILKSTSGFAEYRDVLEKVKAQPEVTAAAPFIFTEVVGVARGETAPMMVKAIDPRINVQRLERYMVRGSLHAVIAAMATQTIAIGDELAKKLGVAMGDTVRLILPDDPWRVSDGGVPPSASFVVGGMFHMSYAEYDQRLAFANISALQQLLGRGDVVLGVEALVGDLTTSDEVAKEIDRVLGGPPYAVQDWFELNRAFFKTRD